MPLLEMRNITKCFPGVKALDSVNLSAEKGEILAIVGENGAGKSTLMKILSGSYAAGSYDGDILINGEVTPFHNPFDAEKKGIAMIYQEINTHLDLSITENLFLGHWDRDRWGRIRWKDMHKRAEEALDRVNLCIDPRQSMRNLNTSHQQLVCIASSLARNPDLLVLDEPTSALTETESEKLFEILHGLKEKGITSLLISHKLDEVFANSDRISVMRDGKSINTHDRSDFERHKIVTEMVGREISNFYPKTETSPGRTILEIEGFTVPHPHNQAIDIVKDVSLSVRSGEILGLAGLVGAGRSELMNALFGVNGKRKGTVRIEGLETEINSPADAIKHGLALVTEDRKADGFVGVLNIHENITLASLKQISRRGHLLKKKEKALTEEYFDRLAIKAPGIYTELQTLSGGNQQKVVLSRWLMTQPKILILDEPTRGIDVGAKSEIYSIMDELARQGLAVIMISSELPELLSMSDRIAVLSGGRISGILEKEEADQEKIMHLATQLMEEEEEYACS